MKWTHVVGIVLVAAAFLFIGRWTSSWWSADSADEHAGHSAGAEAEVANAAPISWTCPMHPEVKLPEFGACPKCGMDLVKMAAGDDDAGPRQLVMSPQAVELARIVTSPVTRQFVTMPIRMVGKVDYDETRVRTIAARVGGRLDRLYVDYTGIPVKTGDHLVWLYSPQLLEAQQELLEAKKRLTATAGEESKWLVGSNQRGYQSAREKLLLWGLSEAQVKAIETRGSSEDHMLIQSPTTGVVIHKALKQGDYVTEGTPIYRIADLTQLWIRLDAFEQDLPWLRYGQSVSVQTEALPGEIFEGRISFIDPLVQESTRTVKVRVQISNAENKLKPGMFVRAVVDSRIAGGGRVMEARLAGKWISPMHPEIVKDGPGTCDVCGMDLVPAEELGYVVDAMTTKPLVVPTSAVLVTGTRAVVYVEVSGKKKPTYEGREIVLGPRAGDLYIVRAGLTEHERVVTQGAFRIDSSMQIKAKPSMLSMRGEANTFTGTSTAILRKSLEALYSAYLTMQKALAADDAETAKKSGERLHEALHAITLGAISREARTRWQDEAVVLEMASVAVSQATSIDEIRQHFEGISRSVLTLEKTFGHVGDRVRYEAFCPMAFDDKGAAWLQSDKDILNPYFGKSMLACGEIRVEIQGVRQSTKSATTNSEPTRPPAKLTAGPKKAPTTRPTKDPADVPVKDAVRRATPSVDTTSVFTAYFAVQTALSGDDSAAAAKATSELGTALRGISAASIPDAARSAWDKLAGAVVSAEKAKTILALRTAFEGVSNELIKVEQVVGRRGLPRFYRVHCSMAFEGKGADWLQVGKVISNPYYGARMLRCGSVTKEYAPMSTTKIVRSTVDLKATYDAYFAIQTALAADDLSAASTATTQLIQAMAKVPLASLPEDARPAWAALGGAAAKTKQAQSIDAFRIDFEAVSNNVLVVHASSGHRGGGTYYRVRCPMAFGGKGADWMQDNKRVTNPYYGSRMLRCGSVTKELPSSEQR